MLIRGENMISYKVVRGEVQLKSGSRENLPNYDKPEKFSNEKLKSILLLKRLEKLEDKAEKLQRRI